MSIDSIPMSQWPSNQPYRIPLAPGPDVVTVTIDGREVQAPRGELLIKVAQDHGTYVPRFCWHERMKPVGMCRMCLVEVEGMRGLQISCATPVVDGMVVNTQSANVKAAQDGVLEFLLINHPLDCPVCDRGGECPLQDQTLAFGPGESRFVEEKRHFEKPIPISDLVLLDRERCIQCGRCTRFADEVAGEPLIAFGGRGGTTEVITFPDEPFRSYFSGNTVQICPVGALTSSQYRFRARPWDLQSVESSCATCAVGCRSVVQSTSNRLVRMLGVDSDPLNQGWLCDKGRYGLEWVHAEDRIGMPLARKSSELVEVSWPEALDTAAAGLRAALKAGPASIGVIGGARGTNEDAYAWARLAKGVLGTDHVDAQLGDGLPADLILGVKRATIADLDTAAAVVVLAGDLVEELPVLFLRLRLAATERGVPVVEVSSRETALTRYAAASLRPLPGDEGALLERVVAASGGSDDDGVTAAAKLLGTDGPVVVVLGRPSLGESDASMLQAAAALSRLANVSFLSALRRSNVHGALDLGLAPGFLPGRVTLDDGRAHAAASWGSVPAARGHDAAGILAATAAGEIDTLVLLGCDLLVDFPDQALVRAALRTARFVVAVGAFAADGAGRADVFLPASVWSEKSGSTTNLEGRVQRVARLVSPAGHAMADWQIAAELAQRFDADFGWESVADVQDEIARVAPAYAGVGADTLRRLRDGAVVPLADHPDEIVFRHAASALGPSWEPIRPGIPDADTHLSDMSATGVAEASGTGASTTIQPGAPAPDSDAARTALLAEAAAVRDGAPTLHRWDAGSSAPVRTPRDAYSLRLVVGRKLYDAGNTASSSAALRALAPGTTLEVHPTELSRIGVAAEGEDVRVTSGRGSIVVPVRANAAQPPGTAFLAIAQPGAAVVGDLVDAAVAVTELRVETVR